MTRPISVDEFGVRALAWLAENLEPLSRSRPKALRGVDRLTRARLHAERGIQDVWASGVAAHATPSTASNAAAPAPENVPMTPPG